MVSISNPDRFQQTIEDKYVFKSPTGEKLHYLGVSDKPSILASISMLYSFIYVVYVDDIPDTVFIDVDSDLRIHYVNGVASIENPLQRITTEVGPFELSVAVSVNSAESIQEYSPTIHVSECRALGLVGPNNFHSLEGIFKDRLLGAINLRVTRDVNGLLSVEACVVNKGEVPEFY